MLSAGSARFFRKTGGVHPDPLLEDDAFPTGRLYGLYSAVAAAHQERGCQQRERSHGPNRADVGRGKHHSGHNQAGQTH